MRNRFKPRQFKRKDYGFVTFDNVVLGLGGGRRLEGRAVVIPRQSFADMFKELDA